MKNAAFRFDRILLLRHHRQPPEPILRSATDLARRCGARLTFADVLEGRDQIAPLFQNTRLRELESLLSPYLDDLEAEYRLIDGDLAAATDGVAGEFDLAFLADNLRAFEAGNREIRRLLRRSSAPVWLDGGTGRAPHRILAAVDVLTRDPLKQGLNHAILERALLLASAYGAGLDVLSVRTPPRTSLALAQRIAGIPERPIGRLGEVRQLLDETVEKALRHGPPLKHEPRVLTVDGLPAESIALTTDTLETDLLIAGCVGRDGLAAWLVGDTAERLARRLDCSILAVKPTPDVAAESAVEGRGRAA